MNEISIKEKNNNILLKEKNNELDKRIKEKIIETKTNKAALLKSIDHIEKMHVYYEENMTTNN
jgi:hypothetical protein